MAVETRMPKAFLCIEFETVHLSAFLYTGSAGVPIPVPLGDIVAHLHWDPHASGSCMS